MRLIGKVARIVVIAVVALACILVSVPVVEGAVIGLWDIPGKINWRSKTSPLDQDTVNDLCLKFELASNDRRCQPGQEVYAPDFFRVIRDTFQPKSGEWATYSEVQQKLEAYQFKFDPPVTTGQGMTYFRAHYDLRGDQVYPIGMFFYSDGRLFRLIADVGD
jgi:hypothetical protein